MNASRYFEEHKSEMRRFIKHLGPYLVAFWAVLGALVGAGWLDTPARSQDIKAMQRSLERQEQATEKLNEAVGEIHDNDIRQTEQLEGINKNLEIIVRGLLNRSRAEVTRPPGRVE